MDHQSFGLDTESIKYAMINQFKTGNSMLDMVLCCLIPLILSGIISQLTNLKNWWSNYGYDQLKAFFSRPVGRKGKDRGCSYGITNVIALRLPPTKQ